MAVAKPENSSPAFGRRRLAPAHTRPASSDEGSADGRGRLPEGQAGQIRLDGHVAAAVDPRDAFGPPLNPMSRRRPASPARAARHRQHCEHGRVVDGAVRQRDDDRHLAVPRLSFARPVSVSPTVAILTVSAISVGVTPRSAALAQSGTHDDLRGWSGGGRGRVAQARIGADSSVDQRIASPSQCGPSSPTRVTSTLARKPSAPNWMRAPAMSSSCGAASVSNSCCLRALVAA